MAAQIIPAVGRYFAAIRRMDPDACGGLLHGAGNQLEPGRRPPLCMAMRR